MKTVAVMGTGPAGLMAADVLSTKNCRVLVFEKKPGPARKLLIAGASGLNISFDAPLQNFHQNYLGPQDHFRKVFAHFSPQMWIEFVNELGIETFKGTSHRYFVKGLKAPPFLKAWLKRLKNRGVEFFYQHECIGFEKSNNTVKLKFALGKTLTVDAVIFALGGASYETQGVQAPKIFKQHSLQWIEFSSSNVGFQVKWPEALLKEAEGQPLKNIVLKTSIGAKKGDAMITSYGLEGTPVYHVGVAGKAHIDLKPDLTADQILNKLNNVKENLSSLRRVKKYLALPAASLALLFHLTDKSEQNDLPTLVKLIKDFPLTLGAKQPLAEAISSQGGLDFSELNSHLMIKKFPGVFVAGEMLNWDAPTGGFLIQACVSQGHLAAVGLSDYLSLSSEV